MSSNQDSEIRTIVAIKLAQFSYVEDSLKKVYGYKAVKILESEIKSFIKHQVKSRQYKDKSMFIIEHKVYGAIISFHSASVAYRFAEELLEDADRDNKERKDSLNQRHFSIGISTGRVIYQERQYIGIPIITASRLVAAAGAGEILVDSMTLDLLKRWEGDVPGSEGFFGSEERILGKHDEIIHAYRRRIVDPAPWEKAGRGSSQLTVEETSSQPSDWTYIRSLEITGVKGITGVRLAFAEAVEECAGWYVLAGGNGTGKSTLLQCLAAAAVGQGANKLVDASWVTRGDDEAMFKAQYLADSDTSETGAGIQIRISSKGAFEEKSLGSMPTERWYFSGYGPFKRMEGGSDYARRLAEQDSRLSRVLTLFLEEAALWEVPKWIYRTGIGDGVADMQASLFKLLNSGLLPAGYRIERIVDDDLLVGTPSGASVSLSYVSDGLRCMLAMVLDIVRGFDVCHGRVLFDGTRVTNPGVVLIDEPDNHLHIAWQLCLASWMKEHFPQIQFIVATHSPFVCAAADKIWRLDDEAGEIKPRALSDEEMRLVKQGSISAILESDAFRIFNTMPPEARDRHLEFLELRRLSLQGKRLSMAQRARLAEYEAEIVGPSDSSAPKDPEFDALFS